MDINGYLNEFQAFTNNPTLDAMVWLMNEFGNPHKNYKIIHVAGTNGKGSCCEILNNILTKTKYAVGKYMSPHLVCLNERTTVNNIDITDEEMEEIIIKLDEKIQIYNRTHKTQVTMFEVTTALAFIYFARKKCDIVIVEVGLGGLLDSTNVIDADISIITSIGYDHIKVLGNTLTSIATQKAGIIKDNRNTVFLDQNDDEVLNVIKEQCNNKNNKLHLLSKKDIIYKNPYEFDYKQYKSMKINLTGKKQISNACICLETIDILKEEGLNISNQAICEGLRTVVNRGRFEALYNNPKIIFDGGHNENAMQNLLDTIKQHYPNSKKVYILTLLKRKDPKAILDRLMQNNDDIFIFTDGNDEDEFFSKDELYEQALNYRKENLYKLPLKDAIKYSIENYKEYIVFVIGSFYIYKDVTEIISEIN